MFIYWVIYEVVNKFSFGLKYMNFRSASIFSLLVLTNGITLVKLMSNYFCIYNNYWYVLFALIFLSLNIGYFGNTKNHLRIVNRFKNKSIQERFFYFSLTGIYIALTILLFIFAI